MKHLWIEKEGKEKLIVFFNGWSMDENPFKFLGCTDFDVCMFFDYQNLNIGRDVLEEINSYDEVYILAWSMGVWAASSVDLAFKQVKKAVAINGTLEPIDERLGIAPKIYDFTLKTMSEDAKEIFWANMFLHKRDFEKFCQNAPKRTLENQIGELKSIKELFEASNKVSGFKFDAAIVCHSDKIFRLKNQMNCWNRYFEPKVFEAGHFPFYLWKSWEEVLNADE